MSSVIHPVDLRVGQNLRRVRTKRGVSQTLLADKVGITFQQIQKYEKGTNRISASMMHDIAEALNVDIITLFSEVDSPVDDRGFSVPVDAFLSNMLDLKIVEKLSKLHDKRIKKSLLTHLDALIAAQTPDKSVDSRSPSRVRQ